MFCMFCGQELDDRAAFCPICGNKAERPVPKNPAVAQASAAPAAEMPASVATVAPAVAEAPVVRQATTVETPSAVAPQSEQPVYAPPAPKKGRKVWLVVLIVVLVLAFAGGTVAGTFLLGGFKPAEGESSSSDELTSEKLAGTWVTTIGMDEMLAASGDTEMLEMFSSFDSDATIDMMLCFYEDGSCEQLVDKDELTDLLDDFLDEYTVWLRAGGLYLMYDSNEILDALLSQTGMTIDQLVDWMTTLLDAESIVDTLAESLEERDGMLVMSGAEYTLDGETILITLDDTEETLTCEYEDDHLTVLETEGEAFQGFAAKEFVRRAQP